MKVKKEIYPEEEEEESNVLTMWSLFLLTLTAVLLASSSGLRAPAVSGGWRQRGAVHMGGLPSNPARSRKGANTASTPFSFLLKFKTDLAEAVTDLRKAQIANQQHTVTLPSGRLGVCLREASAHELQGVANLRLNAFFPEYKTVHRFYESILEKIQERRSKGATILIATYDSRRNQNVAPDTFDYLLHNSILGSVEFSANDFVGTSMENIGSKKKIYLADLCIRSDVRRQGIASQLLEEVERMLCASQHDEIYLHLETDNAVAKKLYHKSGYFEVPSSEWVQKFTEARLAKEHKCYILLRKRLGASTNDQNFE